MKKTADPQVAEIKERLIRMTGDFCDAHLNAEYKRLCRKMIEKMARKRPPPFLRGRLDLWAAGIVYALGSANFLFDKSSAPHISATDLSATFGTKPGSTAQKATQIRDMFDLGYMGSREFLTKKMSESRAKLEMNLLQMAPLLSCAFPEDDDAEPTPPSRRGGEFIDGDHPAMMRFYDLAEAYERSGATSPIEQGLEGLIQRDPDFLDPYLMLADIRASQGRRAAAAELLDDSYRRALSRVLDAKGRWPKSLEWGWVENRHLIRTFLNKAIALWTGGDTEGALDLLRHLLRANPDDNVGARDYILAIRLGMTFAQYEKKFASQFGYDALAMIEWFDANIGQFPDEFDWWKEAVDYNGEDEDGEGE